MAGPIASRYSEYLPWCAMKQRCCNPNHQAYARYGGRGIAICERWLNSFMDFLKDVGPRPSLAHSLHRIDNDFGYTPGNVRWATRQEQSINRANVVSYTLNGETKTLRAWALGCGFRNIQGIQRRLERGWPLPSALTIPTRTVRGLGHKVKHNAV